MTSPSIADVPASVTIGVDTHKHTHLAAAKDQLGRDLGNIEIDTNPRGYAALLRWSQDFSAQVVFGVEGTSSYGAGLARFLRANGQTVIEVLRPTRQDRRLHGKSDRIDANAAASAVQAGRARAVPKTGDDGVEMIRALKVAKSTAIKARTQCMNALKALIMTAPDEIREQLRGLTLKALINTTATFQVPDIVDPGSATKWSIRSMARRYAMLDNEVIELEGRLDELTRKLVPELRQCVGVGQDVAAALVLTAGLNGDRIRSEASFSMLCGSSPIPASSGLTNRHRLNRGGDRQANAALHRIVLVRMRYHKPTREYVVKRTAEGKTKTEIFRCLKRYVAREVFKLLVAPARQLEGAAAA